MSGPIALLVFKLDRDVHTMFPVSHGQPSSGTFTSKRGLKFSSPWAIYRRLTENMIITISEPNSSDFPKGSIDLFRTSCQLFQ